MGWRAMVLLALAACGRFDFDSRTPPDATDISQLPWGGLEKFVLATNGDAPPLPADLLELYINVNSNDIYRTTRASIADAWTAPVIVPELDVAAAQSTPELTPDGLTMYFSSARPGSLGSNDIWLTTRGSRAGAWWPPVAVPDRKSTHAHSSHG